jgi:hypothetical protein
MIDPDFRRRRAFQHAERFGEESRRFMRQIKVVMAVSAFLLAAAALGAGLATARPPKPPKPPKPPATSSVTTAVTPNPVVFGSLVAISGQAVGNKSNGAKVTLYAKLAPTYTMTTAVASTTTDAAGRYSFKTAPSVHTIYYVTVQTAPRATSSQVLVKVKSRITASVSTTTPAAGHRVRFFGALLPAYNGRYVLIQRKTLTGWKTLARAKLTAATSTTTALGATTRSKYSIRARVFKGGTYRVWFNPKDGLRLANAATRKLTIH